MTGPQRILMVNLPFAGHTFPTLELARSFTEAGHQVGYVHSPDWQERIEATGAHFIAYDDYPSTLRPPQRDIHSWQAAFKTLMRIGSGYDCLIYEALFFPGKAPADRIGIPSFRIFSTFALNDHILKELGRTGGWYLTSIFRFPRLSSLAFRSLSKKFKLRYPTIPEEITRNTPELNFSYTTRKFQVNAEDFDPKKYVFVGSSIGRRTDSPLGLPLPGEPVIYISMGTLLNKSPHIFRLCLKAFQYAPINVVMATGSTVSPSILKDLPDNFAIRPFVPQLDVLATADLFITHAGMNSVNEAIYYGVPMVAIPIGNDQPMVARRLEDLHLGRQLKKRGLTTKKLRDTAYEVMKDRRTAEGLALARQEAHAAGGNTVIVEKIINRLCKLTSGQ